MVSESEDKNLIIRRAKCWNYLHVVIKSVAEQGFTTHKKEAECCFSAGLTPYSYIEELNGKRIGWISRVKHADDFGGYEICAKTYTEVKDIEWSCFTAESLGDKSDIRMVVAKRLKDYVPKRGYHPGRILHSPHSLLTVLPLLAAFWRWLLHLPMQTARGIILKWSLQLIIIQTECAFLRVKLEPRQLQSVHSCLARNFPSWIILAKCSVWPVLLLCKHSNCKWQEDKYIIIRLLSNSCFYIMSW